MVENNHQKARKRNHHRSVVVVSFLGVFAILNLTGNSIPPPPPSSNGHQIDLFNPRRICKQNPYKGALDATLEEISDKMDLWLDGIAHTYAKASDPAMQAHNHARFFPFSVMAPCKEKTCVGGECGADTSKIVCGLEQLQQQQETKMGGNDSRCVIYSVGGNNMWEFELDMLTKTQCEVHTFDCTGPLSRFQKPDNERIHFHHVCLGTQHESVLPKDECKSSKCGETWTLMEMQQRLRHNRIDLLKIDIEGFEWPLFESWPELADRVSDKIVLPMQILVEVHYRTQFSELRLSEVSNKMDFRFGRDIVLLQTHLLRMGYIVVERDDNRFCQHCTELSLVRIRCPETGVYADAGWAQVIL